MLLPTCALLDRLSLSVRLVSRRPSMYKRKLDRGFSPPVVAKMHRLSRAAASGVDRTRYTSKRPISFKSHHTQRMSLGIVKADSRAILDSFSRLSASLQRA